MSHPIKLYPLSGRPDPVSQMGTMFRMQPIDPEEFRAGVNWWRTKTDWPSDFHNRDYPTMAAEHPDDRFDAVWWARVEPRLTRWRAFRPIPRAIVAANVATNTADLAATWKQSCKPYLHTDIADPAVTWDAVRAFPEVVYRLKPTRSPVFPSKLCHFLLPKVFPVVDGLALAGHPNTYEAYFRLVKGTWETTPQSTQQRLIAEIADLVTESGRPLDSAFPVVTKIVELALIGRNHPVSIAANTARPTAI